jgi:signal peptidase I
MAFGRARAGGGARSGPLGRPRQINLVDVCATSVLGAVLVILVAVLAGPLFGYRMLLIKSGSMVPTFGVGDLVIDTSVQPLDVRPGQVVSFDDPDLDNQLVTHRVVAMRRVGNLVDFVTEGDANRVSEHWSVPVSGRLGRAVASDPIAGSVIRTLGAPLARTVALAVATLCVASLGLGWIWRRPDVSVA